MKMRVQYTIPTDRLQRPFILYIEFTEAHQKRAMSNHSQTLERLNERGGLDVMEAYAIKNDLDWRTIQNMKVPKDFFIDWAEAQAAAP